MQPLILPFISSSNIVVTTSDPKTTSDELFNNTKSRNNTSDTMNVLFVLVLIVSVIVVDSAIVKRQSNQKESAAENAEANAPLVQIYERGVEHSQDVGGVTTAKVKNCVFYDEHFQIQTLSSENIQSEMECENFLLERLQSFKTLKHPSGAK
jgi:Na+-transporting NADH:ubiquinone oxidoreductase subunit NqrC